MAETMNDENIENTNTEMAQINNKIEIATQILERNIGFITNCDNKTSIVLTAIGVLLTIILTNDGLIKIFQIINACILHKHFCDLLFLLVFLGSIAIMAFGMYKLGSVLIAKTSEQANGITEMNSKIFFSGIKKHSDYQNYRSKFYLMNEIDLLDELIAQIYINADIASTKYSKYNSGFKFTVIGFVIFIIMLLIGIYIY